MKHTTIYILLLLTSISCQQAEKKSNSKIIKRDTLGVEQKAAMRVIDTAVISNDTVPKIVIPAGTIQVSKDQVDTPSKIKILYVSDYNEQDAVNPKDAKLDWKGLFYR